ncbi:unnamed protein product [Phyllotreta striolata]|uniref:Uncharacterized protein n=1 Tax=Phyllotreta striolata TaxID=444603 RepID=A0A9P0GRS8_PHYSR|nr:unnamed protein product [Phyllotreta striolata]
MRGTPGDCRKCACPLENDENNFSPSCQLDYFVEREEDEGNYVCTQCPKGYTGDRCEICDDGYYGNPLEIGNGCNPCDCNGGPCDRKTGQCLSCRGNTEGWKCDKCKPEHYGDPTSFNCKACECDPVGSVSKQCDNVTGSCECKEKFIGRTCDQCQEGYGNVTALCVPCTCNTIGSKSLTCNSHTGICDCKPGVDGFHCDACQNLYYGFSDDGCKPCACDHDGSMFLTCNQTTGACFCKQHFTGFDCSSCEDGYWKKNKACAECKCNKFGTLPNTTCDKETGKCRCKAGVTGDQCTSCLPNHYGTIQTACKQCDPCDEKGHICDPSNGKCVCPPLTTGKNCENCSDNSWGYEPGRGCKHCDCSPTGSSSRQCDRTRGLCSCNAGFEGEKCDRCSFGYFGYPHCERCTCDSFGTREDRCQHGLCKCDDGGTCECKENVRGKHCDECKPKHYGLSKENAKGCTECFCFGRSNTCRDAQLHWSKATRLVRPLEEDNRITEDELSLPKAFLGDLTSSYGGHLEVEVEVDDGFFDLHLEGNNVKLALKDVRRELRMTESNKWKVSSRNLDFPVDCIDYLTRPCFMVVLQNVTSFVVKTNNRITEVLLDKAKSENSAHRVTHSVEQCDCPPQYAGLSCEDPNEGYYRYLPDDFDLPWIDRVIGIAKKCECRGHSDACDPETGHCKNCTLHTTGEHCEKCDDGFYMDNEERCKPCLCPSADVNNAKTCAPAAGGDFTCICKKGYTGRYCDKCDLKYYKPPKSSLCIPCNCNEFGVVPGDVDTCDENGKCRCREGFTGEKCNRCAKEREYIEDGVCKPCGRCAMLLFGEIDNMREGIDSIYDMFKSGVGPPWKKLTDDLEKHGMLSEKYKKKQGQYERLLGENEIEKLERKIDDMEEEVRGNNDLLEEIINDADKLNDNSTKLLGETDNLGKKLIDLIGSLENFGTKHVNLKEALAKARDVLKRIQKASKTVNNLNRTDIIDYCTAINEKVDLIYGKPPTMPTSRIEDLKKKLDKLFDLVTFVENVIKLADNTNIKNSRRLESVKEKIEILKSKNKHLNTSFSAIISKLNATEDVLESLEKVYGDLLNISNFKEYEQLETRIKRQMVEIPEVQSLYDRAIGHVEELERKVEAYHSLFNFTKDEWKKINASGAYEAVINGISEARDNLDQAKKTLRKIQNLILPEGSDNLDTKANLAQTYSDRLKTRINNFKDLSKSLNDMKRRIDHLKDGIRDNGKSNNELLQKLIKTDQHVASQADRSANIEKAIRGVSDVSEDMREVYKKVDDLAFDKQFNFDKKYQKYREQTEAKEIKHLNADLKSARVALKSLRISQSTDDSKSREGPGKRFEDLKTKTQQLENLINLARQQIDGVDVPMSLRNCHMTYKPSKKEYFESLSITFNCDDCTLFNWTKPRETNEESLIVKVKDENIITSIDGEDIVIRKTADGENTIVIQKTGTLLKLQPGTTAERSKKLSSTKIINLSDNIEVGRNDSGSESDGSYVYKIILNGETFGLWKFAETNGKCKGHKRNATVDEYLNTMFNGKGYLEYGPNSNLDPKQFSIRFRFSTFDENSLIYVGAHLPTCSYIKLYLENGLVNFHNRFTNKEIVTLTPDPTTNPRVNDGKSHLVEISWELQKIQKLYITYTLTIDDKIVSTHQRQIARNNVFKIKETTHYLGGVPPTFDASCVPIDRPPFLGFLELKTQLNNANISYGITKTRTLAFGHAWIGRNGYLRLDFPQERLENIDFVVRPAVARGTLIKFNDEQSIDIAGSDIAIAGVVNGSNMILDDYNTVELRLGKTKELIVNGKSQLLTRKPDIALEALQLGEIDGEFVGGIRDLRINNRAIRFDNTSVKSFRNVEIGREKALEADTVDMRSLSMVNLSNTMQNTDRCIDFDGNDVEKDAIKFGDRPNSYTYIASKFWRGNFTIQFDFRTFYPDGVLFVSINKRRNYVLLELKDGQLRLNIEGRKKKVKTLPISSDSRMNDGNWHNIRLTRKLKKLTVIVDKESKPSRLNMRFKPKDEIYFGGVPSNSDYVLIPDLKSRLIPFRGCMRSLEINNERQFLINNKNVQHSNITLCFSKLEEGAYFGGDAFAVYKEDFQISEMLEFAFEFRTSEQNGILLSASNFGDYPALSVELQNGAIVMAVNLGNGAVTNVTNNLNSDIALCNNRWHNVTVVYSSAELTVNVDGIRKSWVQNDANSTMDELEAPLYVGGLPDDAPVGTLKTLTNFRGCIRKLKIENQLTDWSEMDSLNNVLLDSCPVSEIS